MYEKIINLLEFIARVADHLRGAIADFPSFNKTKEGDRRPGANRHG